MATVPVARPNETLAPLRPTYETGRGQSIEAFGGGRANTVGNIGRDLQDLASDLGGVVLDVQQRDNERGAKDLEVRYRNEARKLLFGDPQSNVTGYYGLKGQAAVDAAVPTQEALTKLRQTLMEEASNNAVRDMFDKTSTVLQENNFEGLTRYSMQERRIADEAASLARITAAADDAYANPSPETMAMSIATVQSEVFEQAEREGWQEEQTVQALKEAQSKVYSAAILGSMREDPDAALAMWDQNKAGMTAADRQRVEPALYEIAMEGKAQSIVDEVYDPSKSVAAMRAEIRDSLSGEAETKAIAELNRRITEQRTDISQAREDIRWAQSQADRAREEENRSAAERAQTIVDEIYSPDKDPEAMRAEIRAKYEGVAEDKAIAELNQRVSEFQNTENWKETVQGRAEKEVDTRLKEDENNRKLELRDASEKATEAIVGGQKLDDFFKANPDQASVIRKNKELYTALRSLEENERTGAKIETDWDYYNTVMTETSVEEILNFDPSVARSKLADTEFKQFTALQAAAAAGRLDPKNPTTPNAMFDVRANELGLDKAEKKKQRGRLQSMFQQEIEKAEAENGRKFLTSAETREILNSLTDEVVIQNYYFNSIDADDMPFYRVEVPDDERAEIVDAYRIEYGRVPTDKEIVNLYIVSKNRGQ